MLLDNRNRYKVEVWDVMQLIFGNFNDHQVHCVINFNTHIDESYLKRAVDMSSKIFPLIKCHFVENWFKSYWEECDYTAEDMVKIIKTEKPEEEIQRLITIKTDEFKGPQLRVNIVRSKAYDSLCIIINHMLCDGNGFKEYLYMLSSIYSNLMKNKGYKPEFKLESRSTQQVLNQFKFTDKVKMLCSSADLSKYNGKVHFKLEGDKNNPFIVVHKIPRDKFLKLKSFSKQTNSTINDVIMAAYIRVLHKFLNCGGIPLPCPVNLRKYLPEKKAEGICNLTSNLVCDIGEDIGVTYNETLLKVKQVMEIEKNSTSCLKPVLLLEGLFKLFPYKIAKGMVSKVFNNPPIAMTNIGLIEKEKLVFNNAKINNAYMNGSIKYKPYFQVAVTTFDNELTFSINFCGTQKDKEEIQKFLVEFEYELSQI